MRPIAILSALALLPLAGCLGDAADAATSGEASPGLEDASIAAGTLVPVSLDGNLGTHAWACVPPLSVCQGRALPTGSTTAFDLAFDGALTGISVETTWDAATPLMETLRVGVSWELPDGERAHEMVEGPSPLVLEVTGLDVPADAKPRLWVATPNRAAPAELYVAHEQAFHVEGALATR